MDITLKLNAEEFIKKELEEQIKEKLPEIVNLFFVQDMDIIKKAIAETVCYQVRNICYDILRDRDLKILISNKEYLTND